MVRPFMGYITNRTTRFAEKGEVEFELNGLQVVNSEGIKKGEKIGSLHIFQSRPVI